MTSLKSLQILRVKEEYYIWLYGNKFDNLDETYIFSAGESQEEMYHLKRPLGTYRGVCAYSFICTNEIEFVLLKNLLTKETPAPHDIYDEFY